MQHQEICVSTGVFQKSALGLGEIRREPNNCPGCYTAVAYFLCLNKYTCKRFVLVVSNAVGLQ